MRLERVRLGSDRKQISQPEELQAAEATAGLGLVQGSVRPLMKWRYSELPAGGGGGAAGSTRGGAAADSYSASSPPPPPPTMQVGPWTRAWRAAQRSTCTELTSAAIVLALQLSLAAKTPTCLDVARKAEVKCTLDQYKTKQVRSALYQIIRHCSCDRRCINAFQSVGFRGTD